MNSLVTVEDAVIYSLILSRLIAMFMAFPFLNTALLPRKIKVLLIIAMSFFILKLGNFSFDITDFSWFSFFMLLAKEAILGFSLGLMANIFLASFSYGAEVVSYFMGLTIANIYDPTYGQISILSKFFILLFYLLLFVSGAYQYMFFALVESFKQIPLFSLTLNDGIFRFIIELSSNIFFYGFKLAFPFALILFLINVSLALVNRLIPQINVFIVGLPLQIFVGLAALAFGASVIVYFGADLMDKMAQEYLYLIKNVGR
jgi:flagellar biosynthetic protein FliR